MFAVGEQCLLMVKGCLLGFLPVLQRGSSPGGDLLCVQLCLMCVSVSDLDGVHAAELKEKTVLNELFSLVLLYFFPYDVIICGK